MIRIIADENIPYLKGVLEPYADINYLPGSQINRNSISDADALLVRTRTRCNSELLSGSRVKFIGTATIGFDHIDTDFCDNNNINWTNARGCNSSSVMQYIASALLRISAEAGFSLKDSTLGIIGVGNVGSKVQKLAGAMGMRIILNDPPRERNEGSDIFSSLSHLLNGSDIITLHVPLNADGQDKTLHLFNEETFSNVRKGAWFINSSRGEVAETEAVKDALGGEILKGTVIDVWEREPEIDIPLMHMSFLATPHIAGYSADGKANGTSVVVRQLSEFFNLPLTDWYPSEIPAPPAPLIPIDCNGKGNEEILRKAVLHTYNIVEDDIRLRFDPTRFEKERENYPVRREFNAYTVELRDGNDEISQLLQSLGFKVA
jgi:erythronate-4-phosphate dehydrogenase